MRQYVFVNWKKAGNCGSKRYNERVKGEKGWLLYQNTLHLEP